MALWPPTPVTLATLSLEVAPPGNLIGAGGIVGFLTTEQNCGP